MFRVKAAFQQTASLLAPCRPSSALLAARHRPLLQKRLFTDERPAVGGRVFETTAAEFDKDVLNSDVPTIVDFYAEWCQPCKMLGPLISKAVEKDGRVNLAKINVDENLELAGDYKISSLPTVMAFRDGEPVAAFIGMRPPAAISEFVKDIAEGTEVGSAGRSA
ncbi:hypothetical protein H4S07_000490 [Coemansia furcata]|uniref:Uncharacterized protein n=1 Tax=Coemansia furcata TaxID=417177 RepID=A0ACC1LQ35_9FUNG|nr:hypothetical protein H4S07_000490 [Coemansia furcata]